MLRFKLSFQRASWLTGCWNERGGAELSLHINEQVYALVGVAAMLAANCRVPLTSVLLLFELTRGGMLPEVLPCPWLTCLKSMSNQDMAHASLKVPPYFSTVVSLCHADYYLIIPCLCSVGLSFWAVQYCLRAIAALASLSPDFRSGATHGVLCPPPDIMRG